MEFKNRVLIATSAPNKFPSTFWTIYTSGKSTVSAVQETSLSQHLLLSLGLLLTPFSYPPTAHSAPNNYNLVMSTNRPFSNLTTWENEFLSGEQKGHRKWGRASPVWSRRRQNVDLTKRSRWGRWYRWAPHAADTWEARRLSLTFSARRETRGMFEAMSDLRIRYVCEWNI